MEKGRESVYNSFNAFCARAQASFVELGPLFRKLDRETRGEFTHLAILLNREYRQNRLKYDYLYMKYASQSGPLGSRDRYVATNYQYVKKDLGGSGSETAKSRAVSSIKTSIEKDDRPTSAYKLPRASQDVGPNVILPGENAMLEDLRNGYLPTKNFSRYDQVLLTS